MESVFPTSRGWMASKNIRVPTFPTPVATANNKYTEIATTVSVLPKGRGASSFSRLFKKG